MSSDQEFDLRGPLEMLRRPLTWTAVWIAGKGPELVTVRVQMALTP